MQLSRMGLDEGRSTKKPLSAVVHHAVLVVSDLVSRDGLQGAAGHGLPCAARARVRRRNVASARRWASATTNSSSARSAICRYLSEFRTSRRCALAGSGAD